MDTEKIIFKLTDNQKSEINKRIAIALDTSVWFNLAEYENDQIKRIKQLLIDLTEQGKIFCPPTFSGMSELLKRNYDNAILVAELMDKLSLGVSIASNNEIYYKEIEHFLLSALKGVEHSVNKKDIYTPSLAWIGSVLNIDFPDGFPGSAEEIKDFTEQFAEKLNLLSIKEIINSLRPHLPLKNPVANPNYEWKKRWEENKGDKKKLKQIEKQAVLKRIVDEIIKETDSPDPANSLLFKFKVMEYMNSLPKDEDGTFGSSVLEKMPAYKNMVEVMTFTGFDPNRTDKMNDFYDIDLLIIPMAYVDVVVATDKWIRNLMSSY